MANIILSLWPILAIPRDLLPLNPKEGFYPENTARLLPTLKRNPDFYSFQTVPSQGYKNSSSLGKVFAYI